jgi:hypothetical protein
MKGVTATYAGQPTTTFWNQHVDNAWNDPHAPSFAADPAQFAKDVHTVSREEAITWLLEHKPDANPAKQSNITRARANIRAQRVRDAPANKALAESRKHPRPSATGTLNAATATKRPRGDAAVLSAIDPRLLGTEEPVDAAVVPSSSAIDPLLGTNAPLNDDILDNDHDEWEGFGDNDEWEGFNNESDTDDEPDEVAAKDIDALGDSIMGLTVDKSGANANEEDDFADFNNPIAADPAAEIACLDLMLQGPPSDSGAHQADAIDWLASINVVRNVNFARAWTGSKNDVAKRADAVQH